MWWELDRTEEEGKSEGEYGGELLGEGVVDAVGVLMGDGVPAGESRESGTSWSDTRGAGNCWLDGEGSLALNPGKGEKWVVSG